MAEIKDLKYKGDYIDGRFVIPDTADEEWTSVSPADLGDEIMKVECKFDHVEAACVAARSWR